MLYIGDGHHIGCHIARVLFKLRRPDSGLVHSFKLKYVDCWSKITVTSGVYIAIGKQVSNKSIAVLLLLNGQVSSCNIFIVMSVGEEGAPVFPLTTDR